VGRRVVEKVVTGDFKKKKGKFCDIYFSGKKFAVLGKVYMNESGLAFQEAVQKLKIPPQHLLVIVDDFALPLGKMRYRTSGSAGGHNGLKSIIEEAGTFLFPRLRIGIGRPQTSGKEWVLSCFSSEEEETVKKVLEKAKDFVEKFWISGWPQENMSYNV